MNQEKQYFEDFKEFMHGALAISEQMRREGTYQNLTSITGTALSVLMCIAEKGSCNFKDITVSLNLAKSTLTGVVRQLEKNGYVLEKVNEQDKRIHDLYLTEKGQKTKEEHDVYEQRIYHVLMDGLETSEREMLLSLLKKSIRQD